MNRTLIATAALAVAALGSSFAASAQVNPTGTPTTTDSTIQRDSNQQQRIEQGLQNGTITTREGAELERDESTVNRLQSQELRDGHLSPADQARLDAAQHRTSQQIHTAVNNGVNGNPLSASSQREQAEVQRNVQQQNRIQTGVANGQLTNHEASRLERGQARTDNREYAAGANGRVSANEEARVNQHDDRQSSRIHQQRWDNQTRH